MEVTRRILTERAKGQTFQAIAHDLMADGIATARGRVHWYPATIKVVQLSCIGAVDLQQDHRPPEWLEKTTELWLDFAAAEGAINEVRRGKQLERICP